MTDKKKDDIKKQRDRFLAFSFATADILIESTHSHDIHSCLGATKNLLGHTEKHLKSTPWIDLINQENAQDILTRIESAALGQRIGPIQTSLKHNDEKILLNAIKMPQSKEYYLTFGLLQDLQLEQAPPSKPPVKEPEKLLSREELNDALQDKMKKAQEDGVDANLTFLDIDIDKEYKKRLGKDKLNDLTNSIAKELNDNSIDGHAAGKLSESRYTLLHDASQDIEAIKNKIISLTTTADPDAKGLEVEDKTIDADITQMNGKEASRAILYTLNEFEKNGVNMNAANLQEGFDSHLQANTEKIAELKNFIENHSFDLYFQPIVNLQEEKVCHYETLSRFSYGNTQDWIMFCEDIGMAPDFDIAVCARIIQYIQDHPEYADLKFAINISGQSIGNDKFFSNLKALLIAHPNIHENISFEITESYHIENLEDVSKSLQQLKDMGFKIALDDFGAGAASFDYLHDLHVDYVKIDGKYIKELATSKKDQILVKNIANMCADLNVEVIAEYVENQEIIALLKEYGITYGQGYHFSKPTPEPNYQINKDAA